MNKFLNHKFPICHAPTLDENGKVVRDSNGKTVYAKVSKKQAVTIAKNLCGSANPYDHDWFVHIDPQSPADDILICLDPKDPGCNSVELAGFTKCDNRRVADARKAETQCPYFGTVKCDRQCSRCEGCPDVCTKKCRWCKFKCQECQRDDTTRVISRDNIFTTDGNEDIDSQFDPPSNADTIQEYEDREVLGALLECLDTSDLLDESQRAVLHYTFTENKTERWIADHLGYASKTSVVRIREKALSILRESLKDFRD